MLTDKQIAQAQQWFIESFIHSKPGRTFITRLQSGEIIQTRVIVRNTRYHIKFVAYEDELLVIPMSGDANWAKGIIEIRADGQLRFCSLWRFLGE